MIGYIVFGAARNILGVVLLTALIHASVPLNLSLLIVISLGCSLYVLQVKLFVGNVQLATIIKMFCMTFLANRAMLWLLYEQLELKIYLAQLISVITLMLFSFIFLKSKIVNAK